MLTRAVLHVLQANLHGSFKQASFANEHLVNGLKFVLGRITHAGVDINPPCSVAYSCSPYPRLVLAKLIEQLFLSQVRKQRDPPAQEGSARIISYSYTRPKWLLLVRVLVHGRKTRLM